MASGHAGVSPKVDNVLPRAAALLFLNFFVAAEISSLALLLHFRPGCSDASAKNGLPSQRLSAQSLRCSTQNFRGGRRLYGHSLFSIWSHRSRPPLLQMCWAFELALSSEKHFSTSVFRLHVSLPLLCSTWAEASALSVFVNHCSPSLPD